MHFILTLHINCIVARCLLNVVYFILSSEINAYQKQIQVISKTSEMILV